MKDISIKSIAIFLILPFMASGVLCQGMSFAQENLILPPAGTMVGLSSKELTPLIRGIKVNPQNPFDLDFIIDQGKTAIPAQELKEETQRMVKYFLAILTIPQGDLWVNLSPYEKDRISTKELGITELGQGMLAQDYLLKQLSASLTHPQTALGQKFWAEIYRKVQARYGNTQIKVNTYNKVWIVPQKAVVYQKGNTVFIVDTHLRVMMEEDYTALNKNRQLTSVQHTLASEVMANIVLPQIEKEVNEGSNFATLRQIYNSFILAVWYKHSLMAGILNDVYINKKKTAGVDAEDRSIREKIYRQYLRAFRKGVYSFIREDQDIATGGLVPRKYFSGGVDLTQAMTVTPTEDIPAELASHLLSDAKVRLQNQVPVTPAMIAAEYRKSLSEVAGSLIDKNYTQAGRVLAEAMTKGFEGMGTVDLSTRPGILISLNHLSRYFRNLTDQMIAMVGSGENIEPIIEEQDLLTVTMQGMKILRRNLQIEEMRSAASLLAGEDTAAEEQANALAFTIAKAEIDQMVMLLDENRKEKAGRQAEIVKRNGEILIRNGEISARNEEIIKRNGAISIRNEGIVVEQAEAARDRQTAEQGKKVLERASPMVRGQVLPAFEKKLRLANEKTAELGAETTALAQEKRALDAEAERLDTETRTLDAESTTLNSELAGISAAVEQIDSDLRQTGVDLELLRNALIGDPEEKARKQEEKQQKVEALTNRIKEIQRVVDLRVGQMAKKLGYEEPAAPVVSAAAVPADTVMIPATIKTPVLMALFIKNRRLKLKLSLNDLVRMTGISRSRIEFMQSETNPQFVRKRLRLSKLAEALKLDPDAFVARITEILSPRHVVPADSDIPVEFVAGPAIYGDVRISEVPIRELSDVYSFSDLQSFMNQKAEDKVQIEAVSAEEVHALATGIGFDNARLMAHYFNNPVHTIVSEAGSVVREDRVKNWASRLGINKDSLLNRIRALGKNEYLRSKMEVLEELPETIHTKVDLGEFLKQRRLQLTLTLRDVSEHVGVKTDLIDSYESGLIHPEGDHLIKYAGILRINPEALSRKIGELKGETQITRADVKAAITLAREDATAVGPITIAEVASVLEDQLGPAVPAAHVEEQLAALGLETKEDLTAALKETDQDQEFTGFLSLIRDSDIRDLIWGSVTRQVPDGILLNYIIKKLLKEIAAEDTPGHQQKIIARLTEPDLGYGTNNELVALRNLVLFETSSIRHMVTSAAKIRDANLWEHVVSELHNTTSAPRQRVVEHLERLGFASNDQLVEIRKPMSTDAVAATTASSSPEISLSAVEIQEWMDVLADDPNLVDDTGFYNALVHLLMELTTGVTQEMVQAHLQKTLGIGLTTQGVKNLDKEIVRARLSRIDKNKVMVLVLQAVYQDIHDDGLPAYVLQELRTELPNLSDVQILTHLMSLGYAHPQDYMETSKLYRSSNGNVSKPESAAKVNGSLPGDVQEYLEKLLVLMGGRINSFQDLEFPRDQPNHQALIRLVNATAEHNHVSIQARKRIRDAFNVLFNGTPMFPRLRHTVVSQDQLDQFIRENKPAARAAVATDNQAMSTPTRGGIDLNEKFMDMSTQGEAGSIVHLDRAMIQHMHINGLSPIVVKFTPITNIYLFLGANEVTLQGRSIG